MIEVYPRSIGYHALLKLTESSEIELGLCYPLRAGESPRVLGVLGVLGELGNA